MSRSALEHALPEGDRLVLDTTTLIAYFDGGEAASPVAACLMDEFVGQGRNEAIVSMVTVMELMIRPLRRSPLGYRHVLDFLTRFPGLRAVEVDLPVAQESASVRATHGLTTPDALIVGTGLVHQVGHLVTNDGDWSRKLQPIRTRVAVCTLSAYLPFG